MTLRVFLDRAGREWQVWDTLPREPGAGFTVTPDGPMLDRRSASQQSGRFTPGREAGWLTFTAGLERRRLGPVPAGWVDASEAELAEYLEHSERVDSQLARLPPRTPPGG